MVELGDVAVLSGDGTGGGDVVQRVIVRGGRGGLGVRGIGEVALETNKGDIY